MKIKSLIFQIIFFQFLALIVCCKRQNIKYTKFQDLPLSSWSFNDSVVFKWDIEHIDSTYNIDLHLRASTSYKWSNIFIFSDIIFPNGKARRDTFEFFLADKNGHWNGDKSGLIVNYEFPIYKKVKFPIKGNYELSLRQGMRDTVLFELLNVGIEIEKTN